MEIEYINQVVWQPWFGKLDKPSPFKRDDDEPKLPGDFKVGKAVGGGDCFFDAVAQGIKQLKPQMEFTVKSLRKVCKDFAVANQQIKEKVVQDARNIHDAGIMQPTTNVNNQNLWHAYLVGIEFDREDVTTMCRDNPYLYQALTNSAYGSTLQVPIWGRPDIEGLMICQKFNIKLHVMEKSKGSNDGWLQQVVDNNRSKSVEEIDYNDMNMVHIINKGDNHFEPILRIQKMQYDIQPYSSSSKDNDILKPEEESIYAIKSKCSEYEKTRRIERHFQRTPNLNANFQDRNRDTPLLCKQGVSEKNMKETKQDSINLKIWTRLSAASDQYEGVKGLYVIKNSDENKQKLNTELGVTNGLFDHYQSSLRKLRERRNTHISPHNKLKKVDYNSSRQQVQDLNCSYNEGKESGNNEKAVKFPKKYAASGAKLSLHGTLCQLKLLMLFLTRGLNQNYSFHLATEMDAAERFDDIVFMYENKSKDGIIYRFFQAKHKQDDTKRLTIRDLISKSDGEFSLQKYFTSYRNITKNPEFEGENKDIKDFVIYTNIDIDNNLQDSFSIIDSEDTILDMKSKKMSKRLKLNIDQFHCKEMIISTLEETSYGNNFAKTLAMYISRGIPLDLQDELMRSYYNVVTKKVIDVNIAKFYRSFIQGDLLDHDLMRFREIFLYYLGKFENPGSREGMLKDMALRKIQISKEFRKLYISITNPQFNNGELNQFVNAIAHAVIRSKNGIVKIERERCKGTGVVKDNIDKLAGHVLVKRNEKDKNLFYFSSKFLDETNPLRNGLEIFRYALKVKLESTGIQIIRDKYKFQIANFLTWTEEQFNGLPNDYVSEEDIRSFFEKLVFAVNQPNEDELDDIIKEELGEDFSPIENRIVYSMLQKEILHWMTEKEGRFISHEEGEEFFKRVKKSLMKLELRSLVLKYKDDTERFGIEFVEPLSELESFLASSDKQIFNLINTKNTKCGIIKLLQTLRNVPGYGPNKDFIFIELSCLLGQHIKQHVLNAIQLDTYKLIVIDCEAAEEVDEQTLYEELRNTVTASTNKKIILNSHPGDTLANKFRCDFSTNKYQEMIDGPNKLTDLTIESQNKLLNEGRILFQGVELCLGSVIDDDSKYLIDDLVLSKLVNKEKIIIGKQLPQLGEIEGYYIDRILTRQLIISEEYFIKPNAQDIVAVSNIAENELSNLVSGRKIRKFRHTDSDRKKSIRFFVVNSGENDENHFYQICKYYKECNIHWIKKTNDKFRWQQSYGTLSEIRKFIDRSRSEEYESNEITSIPDRTVILSAESGMGKSTLLTNLAKKMKENDKSLWIVKLNLIDYTKTLEVVNFSTGRDAAINFLLDVTNLETSLERKLFRHKINTQGKIALLFDGFDEICPTYKEKVIKLLNILEGTKVEKLWVTTRPHMRNELEDKLSVFSFSLKALSREDQQKLLKDFWQKTLCSDVNIDDNRLRFYADGILEVLSNSIADKEIKFTGIPLQTKMLAEAFSDKFMKSYDSKFDEQNLSKKLNLLELCQLFVKSKFDIYCKDKIRQKLTKPGVKRITELLYREIIHNHMLLAISILFSAKDLYHLLSQEEYYQLKCVKEDIMVGEERIGIVEELIDERPKFIHQTFAHYFCALWLVRNLAPENQYNKRKICDQRIVYLLRKNLFKKDNVVLRNLFDRILTTNDNSENKYELHEAVLNNDKDSVKQLLSFPQWTGNCINNTDKAGRTALHLAASYGHLDIVEMLLEKGAEIGVKDNIFGWSPVSYADITSHWEVVEKLLERRANSEDLFEVIGPAKEGLKSHSLTNTTKHSNRKNLTGFVKFLVENGADDKRIGSDGKTFRQVGAEKDNLDIARYIVKTYSSLYIKSSHSNEQPVVSHVWDANRGNIAPAG